MSLHAALAAGRPTHVCFEATVASEPHFFFGDRTRAEHEAFDVVTPAGDRLEVVDNVAIAPRVPVHTGDAVVVAGELVPDGSRGPLVHWTHHDPDGVHRGGFIAWHGRRYA